MKRRVIGLIILVLVSIGTSACSIVVGPDGYTRCGFGKEPTVDQCMGHGIPQQP